MVGDRGLAGAGESGQPEHAGLLALNGRAQFLVHVDMLRMDIVGAAQSETQHPGTYGVVGEAVDQDEATQIAIPTIGVKRDRPVELELADANLVQFERLRSQVLQRVHIDPILERCDGRGDASGADFH